MRFTPLELEGAMLVEIEPIADERGFFARTFCETTFREAGLWHRFPQHNVSFNRTAGTVRGMHYQLPPDEEVKLVRCLDGAIDDVIVDIRPGSPTFRRALHVDLAKGDNRALYIPTGFAHGFQTLRDDTVVSYLMGVDYRPGSAAGFRWNDPSFAIEWRLPVAAISDRDASHPDFPGGI